MKKNIHPKVHLVKCIHSDNSSYILLSPMKNHETNTGNSKDRFPWQKNKKNTFVRNAKIDKYSIYDM